MKKFLFFILIFIFCFIYFFYNNNIYTLLQNIEKTYVNIDKYYIYGNHLNMYGNVTNIKDVTLAKLVLKSFNNEIEYDINYSINDSNLNFYISNYINDGILLDDIPPGDYFLFLKLFDGSNYKYFSLKNSTDYNDINYYTITHNDNNNLINIVSSNYNNTSYMMFSVKSVYDYNYYDIVIDAGHGGIDPGASFLGHDEADIVLDYAISLKQSLENLGLRVKLTRDNKNDIKTYGIGSRTSIPYEVKAKYLFSIHLNSCDNINSGGVEIYAPNNSDLLFATSIANNIVKEAKTTYSKNNFFKINNGTYIRTFTKEEILESINNSRNNNYIPYHITTNTNYYYIIRETGGIITNAYVDGRNKEYSKNNYYNSNIGIESYLLELGYINYKDDLNNLIINKEGYIRGITNAIKEEIGI